MEEQEIKCLKERQIGVYKKVKQAVKIPVVVNGDVNEINDYFESKFKSGCDAVMIGREHMEDHGYLKRLNIFKNMLSKNLK